MRLVFVTTVGFSGILTAAFTTGDDAPAPRGDGIARSPAMVPAGPMPAPALESEMGEGVPAQRGERPEPMRVVAAMRTAPEAGTQLCPLAE